MIRMMAMFVALTALCLAPLTLTMSKKEITKTVDVFHPALPEATADVQIEEDIKLMVASLPDGGVDAGIEEDIRLMVASLPEPEDTMPKQIVKIENVTTGETSTYKVTPRLYERLRQIIIDGKPIETPNDLFAYFDSEYRAAESLEENNRRLSRRIYKDTECGAWGRLMQRSDGAYTFHMGSIIEDNENNEREVTIDPIELPCTLGDLREAVEYVEAEVAMEADKEDENS